MNLDFLAVDIRIILKTMYVVFLLGMLATTVFIWKYRRYIPKIVHDCLTGPDGLTYDPARVIGYPIIIIAAFIIICMNIYLGLMGKWDGNAFVTQIGGIFLVHLGQSAAVLVKGNQEPKAGQMPIPGQTLQPIQPTTVPPVPVQPIMTQNQPLQPVQQPMPSVQVPPAPTVAPVAAVQAQPPVMPSIAPQQIPHPTPSAQLLPLNQLPPL